MKPLFRPILLKAAVPLLLFGLVSSLSAESLTPDQVQALRQDSDAAAKALDQLIQQAPSPEIRQDADTARSAITRISDLLRQSTPPAQDDSDIYKGGKKYPPIANVRIENFDVPIGTTEVHVPVTLDKASPNTVIAHVRVFDGQGGRADPTTTKPVIFRPGDPLTKTATFAVRSMSEGANVKAVQADVPDGAERKGGGILITARGDAVNNPTEGGREPLKFEPLGALSYSATGETIQFDDEGGSMRFSTSLPHGRTQVGNGETGYYGTVAMNGFQRTSEGLVLSSRRLAEPVKVGSPAMYYPFLAVMLSGHKTPETHFKYGSVEWVVRMPNRFESWPALWLLPTSGWPPEIDVYEGFGYNGSWKFPSSLSTNLHGGENQIRTFTRPAMYMKMDNFGLADTLDSEFHTHAVTVDPEWITMYVDSVETMRYANPFKGETWYPLTNVAVKAKDGSPYNEGSGDMTIRSIKVWRKE
ncbi:hypothetical protein BH09VER1_BH09VER1_49550 [soil metagenome]